jgi:methionine-rich copper-binding protein CopC
MKSILPGLLLGVLICMPASAHTSLAAATPKSGAELAESPPVIEIRFADTAKLTSAVVVSADKQERKLEFAAGEKPNTYALKQPNLPVGRSEVKWKALSKDGHVIGGTLVFVVKPKSN